MYNLIICGAMNHQSLADGAIFADFMGISMALDGIHADVKSRKISCFPLDKYFERWNDVKWGYIGPSSAPLFVYTKAQWSTRQPKWFEQADPAQIAYKVKQYIVDASRLADLGDTVNVFIQAHGDISGRMMMGKGHIKSAEIVSLLRTFKPGVQVNVVGSHCYSGHLVRAIRADNGFMRYAVGAAEWDEKAFATRRSISNRCRNFRFSQPFIQSLAKIKLPHVEQNNGRALSIADHDAFLRDSLGISLRTWSGESTSQTYASWLSADKRAALTLVEDLIFRDQADVNFETRTMHRRRRVEWPSLDLPALRRIVRQPLHPQQAAMDQALRAVHQAVSACTTPWLDGDEMIFLELEKDRPDYIMLFQNLYWRGRQQSAIFDLYNLLVERDFLKTKSLGPRMNWYTSGHGYAKTFGVLTYFTRVEEARMPRSPPFPGYIATLDPVAWLAAMIARGCSCDAGRLFELIEFTGVLGSFSLAEFTEWADFHGGVISWNCDPDEASNSPQNISGEYFGNWLPHNLGPDMKSYPEQIVGRLNIFKDIERIYKQLYQLDDEELVLEEEQDSYFRRNPALQPRLKHSGSWMPGMPISPPMSPTHPSLAAMLDIN